MVRKVILSAKLLLTNRSALLPKYRSEGVKAVEKAVKRLLIEGRVEIGPYAAGSKSARKPGVPRDRRRTATRSPVHRDRADRRRRA